MLNPKITLIVAVFNAAKTLQRCIDSIVQQTYLNKELIVMDGCSTDGSVDILSRNAQHLAYWESTPDSGIYHAWNKALEYATGDWVLFLGADDYLWSSDVLAEVSSRLTLDHKVAYGQIASVDENDDLLEIVGMPWAKAKRRLLVEMTLPHTAMFHHRALFAQGGFDQSFRIAGDYEMVIRALRNEEPLFLEGIIVAGMQQGGLSSTPALSLRTHQEFRRARLQNGMTGTNPGWLWCSFKAWTKLVLHRGVGDGMTRSLIDAYRRVTQRQAIWRR